jgi:hypothetical protein
MSGLIWTRFEDCQFKYWALDLNPAQSEKAPQHQHAQGRGDDRDSDVDPQEDWLVLALSSTAR